MSCRVALLPGDGIGPEVINSTERVLHSLAPDVEFTRGQVGFGAWERTGSSLSEETLQLVESADATLLGAVTTPPGIAGYRSPVLGLRQHFELFANVRPAQSVPHAASRPGIDLVLIRENTEGLYSGREHLSDDGQTAVTERVITRRGSERILRHAFELASERHGLLTVVHKANVLRETCGLFLRVAQEVSVDFKSVRMETLLVDTCAMRLVRDPAAFDVICTTNLFGDILSDVASELVGGLGLARSSNLGHSAAVFEPVHGSAPDIAGKGIANPLATYGAAAEMLRYLDRSEEARALDLALIAVLESNVVPPDLGGAATTDEVESAVLDSLQLPSWRSVASASRGHGGS